MQVNNASNQKYSTSQNKCILKENVKSTMHTSSSKNKYWQIKHYKGNRLRLYHKTNMKSMTKTTNSSVNIQDNKL